MAVSKTWMEMMPKKEFPLFRLKWYLCGEETEALSDEIDKMRKCSSCKESIDPSKGGHGHALRFFGRRKWLENGNGGRKR
jgi:hypothetical protein